VPVHRQGNALHGQDGGYFEEEDSAAAATAELTGQPSFQHAFGSAFAMMIVSEIGDKTFFIAAIMAMRHSRITVFSGAIGALAVMTVLSAYVGKIATLIPPLYTHYISSLLFLVFGLRMLYEGYGMADDEGAEELEEVTQELKKTDEEITPATGFISPILVQAFTMTFLAEWGDRSQIATIVLGARENTLGVCIGAVLGHACCTCMAVIGGRLVAEKISVRTVTLVGGVTFLLFALSSIFLDDASVQAAA
jgi:putative Ca2+/H+ antiporter (TMEM165/GDT1 family)